jgi:uncharacterized protein (UPF0210 family)
MPTRFRTVSLGYDPTGLFSTPEDVLHTLEENVEPKIRQLRPELSKLRDGGTLSDLPSIRLALSPMVMWTKNWDANDLLRAAQFVDSFAIRLDCEFAGGIASVSTHVDGSGISNFLSALPAMLRDTRRLCGFVQVGTTDHGVNIDLLHLAAQALKEIALPQDTKSREAAARFAVVCNSVSNTPLCR